MEFDAWDLGFYQVSQTSVYLTPSHCATTPAFRNTNDNARQDRPSHICLKWPGYPRRHKEWRFVCLVLCPSFLHPDLRFFEGRIRGSLLCRQKGRQEYRTQETEFRIRYSPSAHPENIKCLGAKRHHSFLTPDFWLLNSVFQSRLSLKALSKGNPKPGPPALRACLQPVCLRPGG